MDVTLRQRTRNPKEQIMKKLSLLLIISILFLSCKNDVKTEIETIESSDITTSIYPEDVTRIFDAHGGIDRWNTMNQLSFSMERPNGMETTVTDLKSRRSIITTATYKLGYDSERLWLKELDTIPYNGNAKFYNGLMFYFYAMPFVLGDDGIIYESADDLVFEGKTYPGILISYENGTGVSSDDQYIVYYNSETGLMEWLGYTVTFGKDSKSNDFHFIRYNNWNDINGLKLPKSIDWYKYENNMPTTKRNTVEFQNINVSKNTLEKSYFEPLPGSQIIE